MDKIKRIASVAHDNRKQHIVEWVDWFNNRRLLGPIGDIPPVELGRAYRDTVEA